MTTNGRSEWYGEARSHLPGEGGAIQHPEFGFDARPVPCH